MNDILDPLILSRWQFGLTTIYHFLFVPLTIGMALVVAVFQSAWVRTGRAHYLQLTRFFGRIFHEGTLGRGHGLDLFHGELGILTSHPKILLVLSIPRTSAAISLSSL